MRRTLMLTWCLTLAALGASAEAQTLEGFARLPADTFGPGPTSGQFIAPANGRIPPFVDKQPVQGVGGARVPAATSGSWRTTASARRRTRRFRARMYRIAALQDETGRLGRCRSEGDDHLERSAAPYQLSDRRRQELYPSSGIPVDPPSARRRLLTGGDFDIESVRVGADGTLWFGDEFGPFLLHTDTLGRVLDAPYPLPGVKSPQNPFLGTATPNLARSKGFEGMAIAPAGRMLYPMLEGALTTDPDQQRLIISEFDLASGSTRPAVVLPAGIAGQRDWGHDADRSHPSSSSNATT